MYKFWGILLLSFTLTGAFAQADTSFSLCAEATNWPYYHPKLKYRGDFWEIKRHFYAGYTAAPFADVPDNSGIVRIRFWVNCKGQVGNYSVECYDLGYAPGRVNANIVSHLMGLLEQLKDWIPATGENGVAVNSHKFFAFRIDGGKLVDILPK